jgi:hypothetical protein
LLSAKDIRVEPISNADGAKIIKALHYSGKCVGNSRLSFGVFIGGKCGGVMQFGPSLDKRKIIGLVRDTLWTGFIELNRLAFADWLPRNSESRALGIVLRSMRTHYPDLKWVISFADACQCGDGAIYRAAGFVLTDIRRNTNIWQLPDGRVLHQLSVEAANQSNIRTELRAKHGLTLSASGLLKAEGAHKITGFMLRYIYFLDPAYRAKLTVPEIPFSRIAEVGASMYRGQSCATGAVLAHPPNQAEGGG